MNIWTTQYFHNLTTRCLTSIDYIFLDPLHFHKFYLTCFLINTLFRITLWILISYRHKYVSPKEIIRKSDHPSNISGSVIVGSGKKSCLLFQTKILYNWSKLPVSVFLFQRYLARVQNRLPDVGKIIVNH